LRPCLCLGAAIERLETNAFASRLLLQPVTYANTSKEASIDAARSQCRRRRFWPEADLHSLWIFAMSASQPDVDRLNCMSERHASPVRGASAGLSFSTISSGLSRALARFSSLGARCSIPVFADARAELLRDRAMGHVRRRRWPEAERDTVVCRQTQRGKPPARRIVTRRQIGARDHR
jgi:hypothetical protein